MEGRDLKKKKKTLGVRSETANPTPKSPHLHAHTPARVNTDNKV